MAKFHDRRLRQKAQAGGLYGGLKAPRETMHRDDRVCSCHECMHTKNTSRKMVREGYPIGRRALAVSRARLRLDVGIDETDARFVGRTH